VTKLSLVEGLKTLLRQKDEAKLQLHDEEDTNDSTISKIQ